MYKGIILLLLAEVCFASATVFAKFVTNSSDISPLEITFFRFFFGVFIAWFSLRKNNMSIIPNNKKFVISRAILNTVAVILFFLSVKHTTVTNANMLNMTYPIFLFIFLPLFGYEKIKPVRIIYLALSILGVYMVIQPNFSHLLIGDILGLFSGIVGGLSVMSLRKAREFDSTAIIIFYIMGIGTIINGLLMIGVFRIPTFQNAVYIIISAFLGIGGQVFITSGYKHIEANMGSIISTSRIIFAAVLGICILKDKMNLELILGGLIILFSIIQLTISERNLSKLNV
jgi:drug/metabolite transporter (DMT)-like permease